MQKTKRLNAKYNEEERTGAIIGYIARVKGPTIPVSRYNDIAKNHGQKCIRKYNLIDDIKELNQASKDPNLGSGHTMSGAYNNVYHAKSLQKAKKILYDYIGEDESEYEFNKDIDRNFEATPVNDQAVKDLNTKFRRIQRGDSRVAINVSRVLKDLGNHLHEIVKTANYKTLASTKHLSKAKTMIVTLADTHIGCYVKIKDRGIPNNYSVTIFKHRFDYYLKKVAQIAKQQNVTRIVLVNLGDQIEGLNMRWNQSYTTEINLSSQVNLATTTMIKAIKVLSHLAPTTVLLIQGNHDRCAPKARDNSYGDSYTRIELKFLLMLNKVGVFNNVHIIDNLDEIHTGYLNIYGKHYLFVHGDNFGIKKGQPNLSHLETAGRPIDYLVFGHFHCFEDMGLNAGKQQILVPSMEGHNRFSKRLGMAASNAGQVVMLAQKGMPLVPFQVDLSGIQE